MSGMRLRPAVVCDASLALAWLKGEPLPVWAERFWDDVRHVRLAVRVPTLFWLELGNHYVRRWDLADEQALEGVVRLERLGFESVEMDRALTVMAIHLARRYRLSAYDAMYLALAETSDRPLATLDGRLATAAGSLGRRYGPDTGPRIAETSASYDTGRVADPISLAALGAYIATLREEIPAGG